MESNSSPVQISSDNDSDDYEPDSKKSCEWKVQVSDLIQKLKDVELKYVVSGMVTGAPMIVVSIKEVCRLTFFDQKLNFFFST